MLAPVVLSTEAPHTLRGMGALPAVALLYGLGTYTLALIVARVGRRLAYQSSSASLDKINSRSRDGPWLASYRGPRSAGRILVKSGN